MCLHRWEVRERSCLSAHFRAWRIHSLSQKAGYPLHHRAHFQLALMFFLGDSRRVPHIFDLRWISGLWCIIFIPIVPFSHIEQAQQIFQGDLDSETKLQLAAVALQALDWRCKNLTERLRNCLLATSLGSTIAPLTGETSSPQPSNNLGKFATSRSRFVRDTKSPPCSPHINGTSVLGVGS
jgi:hypothetical protein